MSKTTEALKEKLRAKKPPEHKPSPSDWLSTGLTLLNLALTGYPDRGLLKGHFYLFVGDSMAGKTWLLLQIMAEASVNPNFNKYRIIFNNPERGALMNIRKYYGGLAKRIETPFPDGSSSKTLEGFYDHLDDVVRANIPFLYGLDSEDALSPQAADKKKRQGKAARMQGEDVKGSYNLEKPKINSSGLRDAHNDLEETNSILVIIKQTRQNIGFGSQFNPKTRSGGLALTYYATQELWFSIKGNIKKTVRGKARKVGSILRIHVKKNRTSGRDRTVEIPFYPSSGLDDVGSLCNFLVEEKHWKKAGKEDGDNQKVIIEAPEFGYKGKLEGLVHLIEEQEKEKELKLIATDVWQQIEAECEVTRKRRYN